MCLGEQGTQEENAGLPKMHPSQRSLRQRRGEEGRSGFLTIGNRVKRTDGGVFFKKHRSIGDSTRRDGECTDVCTASLFLLLTFSLWSRPTVIGVSRGLSDDLEISLSPFGVWGGNVTE